MRDVHDRIREIEELLFHAFFSEDLFYEFSRYVLCNAWKWVQFYVKVPNL